MPEIFGSDQKHKEIPAWWDCNDQFSFLRFLTRIFSLCQKYLELVKNIRKSRPGEIPFFRNVRSWNSEIFPIFWRSQKIHLTLISDKWSSDHLFQKMVEVCQRGMLEVSFSGGRFVKNLNAFFAYSSPRNLNFGDRFFLPRIGCTPLPSSKPPTEPPRYVPMVTTFLRFIGAWIMSR